MSRGVIIDLIDKQITESIHHHARKQEKKLNPECFVAHYSWRMYIYQIGIYLLTVLMAAIFGYFGGFLAYLAGFLSVGWFLVMLYYVTYRCDVDDIGITRKVFFFFNKRILWADVWNVKVQEYERTNKPLEKTVILRNKRNKILFSCDYGLVGYVPLVKLAKKNAKRNKTQQHPIQT